MTETERVSEENHLAQTMAGPGQDVETVELLSSFKMKEGKPTFTQVSAIHTNATDIPHLTNHDNPNSFTNIIIMWTLKCQNSQF